MYSAYGTGSAPAAQSAVATQSLWEETPLSLEGEGAAAVQGNEEVPLSLWEETPLNGSDTPFFNALRQLLQLLDWKH